MVQTRRAVGDRTVSHYATKFAAIVAAVLTPWTGREPRAGRIIANSTLDSRGGRLYDYWGAGG